MRRLLERFFRKHIQALIDRRRKEREIEQYAGKGVVCLICNAEFRSFAPFGYRKRPNAKCPNCGSLERHRLLYLYLSEKTSLFKSDKKQKLLHFAPELMFSERFRKAESITYFPCDLNPEKYGSDVVKADITAIPFDDESMDVILCNHVLEHIPDDRKAMSELYRVMKRGGWGIFQVPIDRAREKTYEDPTITSASDRKKAYGRKDHVRWYGRD